LLETDQDNLHMKFSALTVDFNSRSRDHLCSRKPAHDDIKEEYPFKMHAFGLSNSSRCAISVTLSSECRCKTITTSLHYHRRVCRLLGWVSLDWFAVVIHTCTAVAYSLCWAFWLN